MNASANPVEIEFDFSPGAAEGPDTDFDVAAARNGTALCLSGGGWRAALFHLGALTRLNQIGVLAEVGTVSAVSGGSILAGFLQERVANGWPAAGGPWDTTILQPFSNIAARDLRSDAFRARAVPLGPKASDVLAATLDAALGLGGKTIDRLPEKPDFLFGAADIRSGRYWIFGRQRYGYADTGATVPAGGPAPLTIATPAPGQEVPRIALAIAASSCFPPVFPPMRFDARVGDRDIFGLLVDGGLIDNTGVEAVIKHAATIYVSDGGGAFDAAWIGSGISRMLRYAQVSDHRGRILSRRWLTERFGQGAPAGSSWSIREGEWADAQVPGIAAEEAIPSYSPAVAALIGRIRTDLDSFSEAEIAVLANHGYLTCARALGPAAAPNGDPAVRVPFPAFEPGRQSEASLAKALCRSSGRQLLGRGKPRVPVLDDLIFGRSPDCT